MDKQNNDTKDLSNEQMRAVVEKFNSQMQDGQREDAKLFINEMIENITEPKKKIPEPVFREIFLQYFTGERPMKKGEEAVAHWMGLVGSPTESAEVVDIKGDVLFEVPPMYDSSRINSYRDKNDRLNMGAVFAQYVEQAAILPALGHKALVEGLAGQTKYIKPVDENSPSWDKVLAYYGLLDKPALEAGKSSPQASDDDGFEFEE